MMRTQPPGFRWLVGGFALVAAVAFGFNYRSSDEPADLILGVVCLVVAGYWLIFDREPAADDRAPSAEGGMRPGDDVIGQVRDDVPGEATPRAGRGRDGEPPR